MDSDSEQFDDERLEPFHEQKSRCRRLITYLYSLLQQLDAPALTELHVDLDDQTIEKLARPPLEKTASSGKRSTLTSCIRMHRRQFQTRPTSSPTVSRVCAVPPSPTLPLLLLRWDRSSSPPPPPPSTRSAVARSRARRRPRYERSSFLSPRQVSPVLF